MRYATFTFHANVINTLNTSVIVTKIQFKV